MPTDGDLLTPTLTSHRPRDYTGTQERPPWSAASLVYPAILGGPLALIILGPIEAGRLRAPRGVAARIVALSAVCLAAGVVLAEAIGGDAARLIVQAFGLAAFGGAWLLLRGPDRVHSMCSPHDDRDSDHESILPAAVGTVLVCLLVNGMLQAIVADVL